MCILHCLHFLPCWPLLFHVCSSERNADACAWCNFNSCSEFPCPPFLVSKKEKRDRNVPYNVYSCCSFTALTLAVDPKLSLPCCSFFFLLVCRFYFRFLSHPCRSILLAAWRESYGEKARLVRLAKVERERGVLEGMRLVTCTTYVR